MVLQGKPCGRVGRRRKFSRPRILTDPGLFFAARRLGGRGGGGRPADPRRGGGARRRFSGGAAGGGRAEPVAVGKVVGLGALIVLLAGCIFPKAGPLPGPVTSADVARARYRWPDASAGALARGRALFAAHCNACHHYPDLMAISDDRWPGIIQKMARKAHLTADESAQVLRFVLAARAR